MERKAFCLLSGGIDSTTCLHKAIFDYRPANVSENDIYRDFNGDLPFPLGYEWVEAISVNYGQRHIREGEYAAATCKRHGIKHTWLNIGDILAGGNVMLTNQAVEIPNIDYADIKGVSPTYVPFRNGTLLACITAYAQKWVNAQIQEHTENIGDDCLGRGAKEWATLLMKDSCGIYFGAHAEDAANWAYPDCTPEFIGAMANAIYIGSYMCIRLHTPIQWLMKDEIIKLGEDLAVDWTNTWSCYAGGISHCGTCPTCRARKAGFKKAGLFDPTQYAA